MPEPKKTVTFTRLDVQRLGNDSYRVAVQTWEHVPGAPTAKLVGEKVQKPSTSRIDADYRAKVWLEGWLGPNRTGDCGL